MWRKIGIEPGEGRVFVWGAAALFLLGWTDVSVKNVAETFFIKRVGKEWLPHAFLASSLLLVATTWSVGHLAARRDRLKLLPKTFAGLGLSLLPLWLLVRGNVEGGFVLLVLASKQLTSISLLVFWIAMGDLLHGRQAKRLFAPMMAGVTVGTILGSFASWPLGRWLGIDGLLPISAVTLVLAAAASLPLRGLRPPLDRAVGMRAGRPRRAESEEEAASGTGLRLLQGSSLFRLLFMAALCSGLLGPMLYYQFQHVADLATSGAEGEQRLMAFYSQFRGWIYGGVLVTQLAVSGSLYRRIGVPLATAFSPVLYLLGFLGLSVRLSLPAGVGAMAGTKLQDNAVYDPALRVLYNLFPEETRSRASALLEGPVKRAGGAIGNAAVIAALGFGSALWVGYFALPIAVAWLAAALWLWRRYPGLLLHASVSRSHRGDAIEGAELLDPATLRALVPEMCAPDPARARAVVELVSEAEPARAVAALSEAAGRAPPATRPIVVEALDRLLEDAVANPLESPEAARQLEALLAAPGDLADRARADLVQAYGRLLGGREAVPVLERALEDPSRAVRLAALAALVRRGVQPPDQPPLDSALAEALGDADAAARRTAREEVRSLLLGQPVDAAWHQRLEGLAAVFAAGADRAEVAEALAEVAARHGEPAAAVAETLMGARNDPDPRVCAALLRYAGHAGLVDQMGWLVEQLGADREEWVAAAREGLCAIGPVGSNALLRELAYGKRSKRDGILGVMRELDIQPEALRALYEAELDAVERDLHLHVALAGRPAFALLRQRLEERVREQLHTALLFLAAIRHEDRIAELGERLQQVQGRMRKHAIVLEALEALLSAEDKARLVPLLEDPHPRTTARTVSGGRAGSLLDEAIHDLLEDPEELTRSIAVGLAVAAGFELEEHDGVDAVEKMLHLKALPLFEGLTVRQLMDLASVAKETAHPPETVVVVQGEYDDCLYLVVEGVVQIRRGETLLAEMGPGDFFGEIALFEGVARSATAVTQTRVRLLGLERSDLMHLIEESPGIAVGLLQTLSRRVRELTDRLMV
jgi:hypothetical protein